MSSSRNDEALKFSKEIRYELFKGEKSVSSMLLGCKTICRYLGISEENQWIDDELDGYTKKWKTQGELYDNIPEYRKTKLLFFVGTKTVSPLSYDRLEPFAKYAISEPISEVEAFTDNYVVTGSATMDALNDYIFKHVVGENPYQFEQLRVKKAEVSTTAIRGVIEAIKRKIGQFVDEIILELEYGKIPEEIFEQVRKEVDHKLTQICPSAVEKLTVSHEALALSKNPETYSQIASTCRRIIKDVADVLYPPSDKPIEVDGRKIDVGESHYKNRILTAISSEIKSKNEKSFITSMFDYVDSFLSSINDYASKGDHSEFNKTDATRCVIYTYLLLGDILHYYSKERN